ncbi:MAG: TlpA family protein disulfide reductase, partial [Bacteroidetes bacterium]|nr:TlpA family protein disulfide reductase [Bacteroidota bacterium]
LIAFFIVSFSASSKDSYHFKIKMKDKANKTCLLAFYHSGSQYIKDTFETDDKGFAEIKGDEKLDGGLYLIAIDGVLIFDFVYSGKENGFSIELDPADPYRTAKIKGSKDNELFFSLNVKRVDVLTDNSYLDDSIKSNKGNEAKIKAFKQQKTDNMNQLNVFTEQMAENNKGTFTSNFINIYREKNVPEPSPEIVAKATEKGEKFDSLMWKFYWSVNHYWDLVDFSDDRIIRTPMFKEKVMMYFKPSYSYSHPDSLAQRAIKVIDLACAGGNYEMFKNVLTWIFGRYQESKVLGHDGILVALADKYYLTEVPNDCKADWLKPKQLKNLKDYVDALRYTKIDMQAPMFFGQDLNGATHSLYDIDAEYTLVYVWSATCGHCKKVTPKFLDVYHDFKDKGFEVVAINNDRDDIKNEKGEVIGFKETKEYHKFVNEKQLDWLNVTDLYNQSDYRKLYGINSTPKAFLLDKDKKIIAPRLDHITLRKILMNKIDGMTDKEIDKFLKENGYLDDLKELDDDYDNKLDMNKESEEGEEEEKG